MWFQIALTVLVLWATFLCFLYLTIVSFADDVGFNREAWYATFGFAILFGLGYIPTLIILYIWGIFG